MSTTQDHYMEQAEKARTEADLALLDNVRDRCLRSEAAWLEMAARAARHERLRARTAAEKADKFEPVAAEAAEPES